VSTEPQTSHELLPHYDSEVIFTAQNKLKENPCMMQIWPYQNLYTITENELLYFKTMEHRLCKWKN